ncbi:HigA family addiction module antidote protein [Prevotella sp. PINT]|uniref:HigA family addiction module antitoxin n=1 Tax=Palleniella intestinalis TaxID=2736291 RepID=UPI001557D70D|nr:HigA family addiction module antitoxin [Palleniella intestinalis]NPD81587.1 HigA family addiction module antidote protein [Palleniella intestinalis]
METKKTYAPHELRPSTPIHPGEILRDELEARDMSQRRFADIIGVSYSVLNEVINGKRSITTEYALKIEAATDIPAYIWVNMQTAYNMHTARRDRKLSVILDKIRKSVAVL